MLADKGRTRAICTRPANESRGAPPPPSRRVRPAVQRLPRLAQAQRFLLPDGRFLGPGDTNADRGVAAPRAGPAAVRGPPPARGGDTALRCPGGGGGQGKGLGTRGGPVGRRLHKQLLGVSNSLGLRERGPPGNAAMFVNRGPGVPDLGPGFPAASRVRLPALPARTSRARANTGTDAPRRPPLRRAP